MRTREKVAWSLLVTLGLAVVASLASVTFGGPLDPPGPIGPSMKSLGDIPGSWSRSLPADNGAPGDDPPAGCNSTRFQCVLPNNEGVLDHETGLVWERHVGSAGVFNWQGSQCALLTIGSVQGWRLPTMAEINSLADDAVSDPPYIPAGHPFINVHPTDPYWTKTSFDSSNQFVFSFDGGYGYLPVTDGQARAWCVRGPE